LDTDDDIFEAEVLRTARALFSENPLREGSTFLNGTERDGIFITADAVTVIEATTSRRLDKAEKDGKKLKEACATLSRQHPFKSVKGYFVTQSEPTADQRKFIRSLKAPEVVACSHAQLRAQLIDAREYLASRQNYPFGSARNPASGDHRQLDDYVPIGFNEPTSTRVFSVKDVVDQLVDGRVVLLTGDYGAGKSMALREIHSALARKHLSGQDVRFPVAINLRDHRGQIDPDEALERHGRRIGFEQRSRLVRSWLAGDAILLMDGFDEIATPGWLGRVTELRDVRRRSVELVRRTLSMKPSTAGALITGRTHFFDSADEMKASLGVGSNALSLRLDEFSESQVSSYLTQHGWSATVPSWLPTRPLLLGYLVAHSLLTEPDNADLVSAADGWNNLLERICEREANMEVGVDGLAVRRILERLSTVARGRPGKVGPVWQTDLTSAFESVTGQTPDEGSYQLLQRLPGLGIQDASEGSRYFIDDALADAARSGDIARYAQAPHSEKWIAELHTTLDPVGELGVAVAATQLEQLMVSGQQVVAAAERGQRDGVQDAIVFDLVRVASSLAPSLGDTSLAISDISIERIAVGAASELSSLSFTGCIVEILDLTEHDGSSELPMFQGCMFGTVLGVGGTQALNMTRFADCEFEQFDAQAQTTSGLLAISGLSPLQRVALTILKKLYAQRGTGRKENALHRGLDDRYRQLVPEALERLEAQGLAIRTKAGKETIFLPARGQGVRVRSILESGAAATDDFIKSLA